jgi:hypothetical protein
MAFPSLTPSSRTFNPGDYPVRTYVSQSGTETRILYGSKRTGMKLGLAYKNISDANAELFLDDFEAQKGTYKTFDINSNLKGGWDGNSDALDSSDKWRYESAPVVTQVRKGVSNVQVNLVGVI